MTSQPLRSQHLGSNFDITGQILALANFSQKHHVSGFARVDNDKMPATNESCALKINIIVIFSFSLQKSMEFCFVILNAAVETVKVQINAIPFIFFQVDVRSFELRTTVWRKRNQNRWHSSYSFPQIVLSAPLPHPPPISFKVKRAKLAPTNYILLEREFNAEEDSF